MSDRPRTGSASVSRELGHVGVQLLAAVVALSTGHLAVCSGYEQDVTRDSSVTGLGVLPCRGTPWTHD